MKSIFCEAMSQPFDLSRMLQRIERHHILGNLSDPEREELILLAREKANPFAGVDVLKKLEQMESRLRALEEGIRGNDGNIPQFQAGTWYRAGDKVMFSGQAYICTAPENTVCIWNPREYPAYWQLCDG